MLEIKTDDYQIWHDLETSTVFFRGFLRLAGMEEYRPVMELLMNVFEEIPNFTIDLQELEFLNSSGISMLSMFVIKVREKGNANLVLRASDKILWQTKSLKNLQRLMPGITIEFS
ncbi:slr1659 superfamily regulator [Floridanema evergladense]|uniref:STAS domain-containing protein n=1 Tax=Floridaenema evergladense BLCC-F167 TaxID=3153639 RepID=A0ABV4WK76_9CYAN